MPKIGLFIPTYQVASRIEAVLADVQARVGIDRSLERVWIIDNGSSDGTLVQVRRWWDAQTPEVRGRVTVLRNAENYWLGGSTIVAFREALAAGLDVLVCMHGDGQARAEDLARILEEFERDPALDLVLGSRFLPESDIGEYSRLRTWGNRFFGNLQRWVVGREVYDVGCFIGFSLQLIERLPYARIPHDMAYQSLLVLYALKRIPGLRFREIPVRWGRVETSHVSVWSYGRTHLGRLAQLTVGRLRLTEKEPRDFRSVSIL